ncbi:type VI secretion system contractile sheath small subunit [Silvanigrella paludirubra]|uniref:Type VI secretion system contractile sheath small subunit n=1 Tax=Silvanigrella paludirubra TaxID=2499159 RepID=A0A6N6VV70_9BACT|nr:type VI secretion system contractile sheath small subunit [Silvanigrella paludirubra]KAB8039961.1 type VI secretion system contractile sheath small subunit [Silvanigrella paludirubra]
MSALSIQHKLKKVRPPRVQITYDLHAEGGLKPKDLPFVIGLISNLSGHKNKKPQKIKQCQFLTVEKENYNSTMQKIAPEVSFTVENTLEKNGSNLAVNLKMESMADFTPGKIAENHPTLSKLLEVRKKLIDLQSKVDSNESLEVILKKLMDNKGALKKLAAAPEKPNSQPEETNSNN